MTEKTAILKNNNDHDDVNDLPQADSLYMHFLDSEKWKNYSRRKFMRYLIIGVIALIVIATITVISLAVILAHNESDKSNNVDGSCEINQQICHYRCYCSDCSFPSNMSILERRSRCADCICPFCEVNRTFVLESNMVFNVSELEVQDYLFYHLPWGVPQGSDDRACLLAHFYYIIKYSTFYHIPLWVAYKLNGSDLGNHLDRRDCFRRDPRIPIINSSNCSDYSGSGFDRGHIAPNGDFNYNRLAQLSTFVLTNVAPQYHALNAGIWRVAENKVREWARTYSVIYVISGSILGESRRDRQGNYDWWIGGCGHAAVPTHFYKILSRCNDSSATNISDCSIDNLETLTFLFEHVDSGVPSGEGDIALLEALTTIRDIELLSGMDFFTYLTKEDQDIIELEMATALWE